KQKVGRGYGVGNSERWWVYQDELMLWSLKAVVKFYLFWFFFFSDTATTKIDTRKIVGSVRCV
ncbi:hypothetical protein LKL48_15395, partial [Listeria monocytogenes]